jgi:arginyl-tRNA synthetase
MWGSSDVFAGKEILLEYTSPNLFKPLHVGNLVGNIIGESLARLFEYAGATVRRINYPSDIGLTVAKGVWGLTKTGGNPEDIMALGEAYRFGNEGYENDPAAKAEIEAVNRALYASTDEVLSALRTKGIVTSKARLDALCALLGTTFDAVIYESEAGPQGTETVKSHIGDVFEESEGAIVYKGEKVGLHTRVFLNSQGLPTYEAT